LTISKAEIIIKISSLHNAKKGAYLMDNLVKFREEARLTQKQLAYKIGISESYYCLLEKGKRRMSLELALKIATVLKKTPNDIFLPNYMAKSKVNKPTGTTG
jgi:DNA-binding XRE family transcriptional regulator